MKLLVTGGAGFIGSHFVRWMLSRHRALEIVNLDKLTYAGRPENLRQVESDSRYRFLRGDVAEEACLVQALAGVEQVVHFAAESHVDRSIHLGGEVFTRTNVVGTQVLLEAARAARVKRFVMISTDEVYGPILRGAASETDRLSPRSPYAASKAGADLLVQAYTATFGMDTVIVRGCNNFGPYQFPEKFLPLLITHALEEEPLPVYGDGQYIREWIFVEDFCEAVDLLLQRGRVGEIYNVGTGEERVNLEVARALLHLMGKPEARIRHVTDRPGHDRRYAIASDKVRALGWAPRHRFEAALQETVRWYETHADWWRPLKEAAVKGGALDSGTHS